MSYLLPLATALAAGAAAVLLTGVFPALLRRRTGPAIDAVILLAAVAALLARSSPTGTQPVDLVLNAGIAALAAWVGAAAPHRILAALTLALTVLLGFSPWAAAGAGVAIAVVLLRTRLPALKASAGALTGLGLVVEIGPQGPSWREAVAFAILVVLAGVAARRSSDAARRNYGIAVSGGLALLVVAAAGFLFFAIPAARELNRAVNLSEGATAALTDSRVGETGSSLALAASAFGDARERLTRWPARVVDVVPIAAQNAAALRALAGAGEQVATAATAVTTGPGDLRVAEGRIDLNVIDDAALNVRQARGSVNEAIADLRATRSRSLLPPIAEGNHELHARLADAGPTLALIERALEHLPPMLGGSRPRRYLLALQSPSESRAAGGIIGSFGVLEASGGQLELIRTGSVDETLNDAGEPASRTVEGVDQFMARYGRFQPLQTWQNLSLTPDWPTVGAVAHQLFPQSGGQPIDGVIGLDPFALAGLLNATGPVDVPPWPVPITADNAVSVLMHEQYLFFPNPERREFVADVTAAVFERLTGEGASLRAMALALAESAERRNVQLWSADAEEEELFRDIGADGGFPEETDAADLVSVINQNSSGNKIDWFLHRTISYEANFDPVLGRVDSKLRVELRNDAPSRGLPHYVIGGAGPLPTRTDPGENRTWLNVYSPLSLQAATVNGQPLEMERAGELGHQVYSAFVVIPPKSTLTVELDLSGLVDPQGSSYRALVRSQVLPNPDKVSVTATFPEGWEAEGKAVEELILEQDRVLRFGFRRPR